MGKREKIPIRAFSMVPGAEPKDFPAQPMRGPLLEVDGTWGSDGLKKAVAMRFRKAGHIVRKVFWSMHEGQKCLMVYVNRDAAAPPDAHPTAPPQEKPKGRRTAVGRRVRKKRTK